MTLQKLPIFILLILCSAIHAQVYRVDQTVPVTQNGAVLNFPWSGGLNSGQYNTMDINQDGLEDLIVFDRSASKLNVFINTGGSYEPNFEYANQFPENLRNWILLRDYDCDGKKDLFASDPLGIRVYQNVSDADGLKWRLFNDRGAQSPLLTKGFSNNINLQLNTTDIPSITDVDGDGDLDILNFRFTGSSTIEFHKNLSVERSGTCDSLQLERVTQAWGEFEQCLCEQMVFGGDDCSTTGGRTKHQGGKALFTFDMDNDGDHDAVVSEETCTGLYFLENEGNAQDALMQSVSTAFPNAQNPAQLFVFPAAYYEDVDFDGVPDLLVAPNVPSNIGFSIDLQRSSWFYKNTGTLSNPTFQLVQRDFLQDQMLEFGENAVPAFFDYDADGDLDMFISNNIDINVGFSASIKLYNNIGNSANPTFELDNDDFFSISGLNLINVKPAFEDVDSNGTTDLVLSGSNINNGSTSIIYFENLAAFGLDLVTQPKTLFNISNNVSAENFKLFDIDTDGKQDLLIGRNTGRLEYYRNIGTAEIPDFLLEDQDFLGFVASPFTVNSSVDIADIDGDNTMDLLIGDARGNLSYYLDFMSSIDSEKEGEPLLFETTENISPAEMNLGTQLIPRVVNLFNEDKPAIVVGTGQGGLNILRNTGAELNPIAESTAGIYPNPAINKNSINFRTTKRTFGYIVSLTGQRLTEPRIMEVGVDNVINVSNLSAGMYLLVTTSEGDGFSSFRFVVDR